VRDVNKIVDGIGNVFFATTDSQAADKGATLSLGGSYVGSSVYPFGAIAGRKANSTSSDASGYLAMYTTNPSNTIVERARIDSVGNVGFGCTPSAVSTYKVMEMNGTAGSILYMQTNGTRTLQFYSAAAEAGLYQMANAPLLFATNNVEKARFTAAGDFLVGTTNVNTSPSATTVVSGGNFRSLFGSVVVPASSTVTVLTLSSSVNGTYIIQANLGSQGNAIYGGMLIVVANAGSFRIVTDGSGSSCSLTLSGANVRITNPIGSALDGFGSAILIASY
jgi:hypothetical protein